MEGRMSGRKIFPQLEPRRLVKLWVVGALFTAATLFVFILHPVVNRETAFSSRNSVVANFWPWVEGCLILVWVLIAPSTLFLAWKTTPVSRLLLQSRGPAERLSGERQLVLLWAGTTAITLIRNIYVAVALWLFIGFVVLGGSPCG
jgi:hypothetical protein